MSDQLRSFTAYLNRNAVLDPLTRTLLAAADAADAADAATADTGVSPPEPGDPPAVSPSSHPWHALGISRATYFRRRAGQGLRILQEGLSND